MKRRALFAVLTLLLAGATEAQAGSATTGQVSNGNVPSVLLGKRAGRLLGSWEMSAIQTGQRRIPVPGSVKFTFTFKRDASMVMRRGTNGPRPGAAAAKPPQLATWSVQGNTLIVVHKGKPTKLKFQFKGVELMVQLPGKAGTHIYLRRVKLPRP